MVPNFTYRTCHRRIEKWKKFRTYKIRRIIIEISISKFAHDKIRYYFEFSATSNKFKSVPQFRNNILLVKYEFSNLPNSTEASVCRSRRWPDPSTRSSRRTAGFSWPIFGTTRVRRSCGSARSPTALWCLRPRADFVQNCSQTDDQNIQKKKKKNATKLTVSVEFVSHQFEVGHGPVKRVDLFVVRYVVAEIVLGWQEYRRQPYRADVYAFKVRDFFRDSCGRHETLILKL